WQPYRLAKRSGLRPPIGREESTVQLYRNGFGQIPRAVADADFVSARRKGPARAAGEPGREQPGIDMDRNALALARLQRDLGEATEPTRRIPPFAGDVDLHHVRTRAVAGVGHFEHRRQPVALWRDGKVPERERGVGQAVPEREQRL